MDVPIKPIRMFLRMKKISKIQSLKFGYSEKATKFEKIFHLKFDATQ